MVNGLMGLVSSLLMHYMIISLRLKILAEDLGELSNEVIELRSFKNIPGMKVFQFDYENISKNEKENKVLFTGTHDNDTLIGWYDKELKDPFRNGKINFQIK